MRARIRAALEAGEPIQTELTNYNKAGQAYLAEVSILPLRDTNGRITHFAGVAQDVTARRRAEAATREAEQMYRSVVSTMAEGVVVMDADGFIISCNESAARILGVTQGQMLDRTSGDPSWACIRPDGSYFPGEELPAMRTLRTGEPLYGVRMGIRKADERVTWISINTHALEPDAAGRPSAVVATFTDITDQVRAERAKNDFVSTVSHELRTPLTSVRGALGILLGTIGERSDPQSQELLTLATRNCDRLGALINDLLDIEKFAFGHAPMESRRLGIAALIEEALTTNLPYAQRYAVQFQFGGCDPALEVLGDEGRLLQVLANLLSNAAKFSPRGGRVGIQVGTVDDGEGVRISVSDEGPGIPAGFRAQVFQRFAQAKPAQHRVGGTGLGLAISKTLIERHGGRIGFRDNRPRGTVFYFDLPLAQSARNQVRVAS
jgi:PAS domain S-box-containing protein